MTTKEEIKQEISELAKLGSRRAARALARVTKDETELSEAAQMVDESPMTVGEAADYVIEATYA